MKRIDVHSHVIPETIQQAMREQPALYKTAIEGEGNARKFVRGNVKFDLVPEFYDADAKVESMDRKGIDISVISPGPQAFFYGLGADQALKTARIVNEGVAKMAAARPDRLRGMATLPMQDPDAAITELERVVKEYKFKAVEMGTSIEGEQLAHPRFRPVLKTIEQLGCFIFTHPYACSAKGGMDRYEMFNTIGYPLDSTLMVAHLMASGALDELKTLRIVIPHGGGYVPYQIGRFDRAHKHRPAASVDTKSAPYDLFKRFYFDALTHDPRSTRHLINMAGADHVVIGTDNPFNMGYEDPIGRLDATPGLTAEEKALICGGTASRLLGEG